MDATVDWVNKVDTVKRGTVKASVLSLPEDIVETFIVVGLNASASTEIVEIGLVLVVNVVKLPKVAVNPF